MKHSQVTDLLFPGEHGGAVVGSEKSSLGFTWSGGGGGGGVGGEGGVGGGAVAVTLLGRRFQHVVDLDEKIQNDSKDEQILGRGKQGVEPLSGRSHRDSNKQEQVKHSHLLAS